MQNANILNLPENYTFKYCASLSALLARAAARLSGRLTVLTALAGRADLYHALTWPQLSYVAEDPSTGKIVGYILAKMYVSFLRGSALSSGRDAHRCAGRQGFGRTDASSTHSRKVSGRAGWRQRPSSVA